jgi:hypothetical protein
LSQKSGGFLLDEVGNFPKLWPTNFRGKKRKQPFFMEIFTGDTTIQYTLWLFNIAMEAMAHL